MSEYEAKAKADHTDATQVEHEKTDKKQTKREGCGKENNEDKKNGWLEEGKRKGETEKKRWETTRKQRTRDFQELSIQIVFVSY